MTSATVKRLKYLASPQNRKVAYSETDRPYIGLEDIESGTGRLLPGEREEPEGIVSLYDAGDVLFGKLRPYLAKVHLAKNEGACSTEALVLRSRSDLDDAYLKYVLLDPKRIDEINASTFGAQMPRASWDFIGNCKVPVPDLDAQKAIAAYLDRETARIDQLIAKRSRFVELLRELRVAVVSRAVTRGIDTRVEFKESGVDWLGKIPAHWQVVPPTALFRESKERARDGDQLLSATQKYGVIPLAEYEELEQRQVTLAVTNLEMRKHVEVGDFVISMRSMDGGLERAHAAGCVRSSYSVLKAGPSVEGRFYGYLLKSSLYIQALRQTANFIRDGQDMNFGHFRKVRLPRLEVDEQRAIADYIDAKTTRIDALVTKTERSIGLLREHRAALITAAVTGQLDIRDKLPAVTTTLLDERRVLSVTVQNELVGCFWIKLANDQAARSLEARGLLKVTTKDGIAKTCAKDVTALGREVFDLLPKEDA